MNTKTAPRFDPDTVRSIAGETYVAAIKQRHERKRNLMKLLA